MGKWSKTINRQTEVVAIAILFLSFTQFLFSDTHKIGVMSDIHYLSEQLMDDGVEIDRFMQSSGQATTSIPLVLDQVLANYAEENIDILLICGDLTKNGEKQSHTDLKAKLLPLINKGTRIFVVPGNHDINIPNAVRYKGDKTYPTESISPKEFEDIYSDCGFSEAIGRDSASLSYVAEIDNNTWLLAIDACRYKEYQDKSISAGAIGPSTQNWILNTLNEARSKNKRVISMMHHGLVEHFPYQSIFFSDYLVKDWYNLAGTFANEGVKVIFTGHFHANDIAEFVSSEGNKIYDVETSSLCSYPFAYRYVTLTPTEMVIETKNMTSIAGDSLFAEKSKDVLREIAKRRAVILLKEKLPEIASDKIDRISDIAAEVFLMHLKGDEIINDEMLEAIRRLSIEMDFPIDLSPENFNLDFPPADNSLHIHFREEQETVD